MNSIYVTNGVKGTIFCHSFRVAIEIDTKNSYKKEDL
jgi:hypothetical protein